jgi:hypothetical protein
MMANFMTSTVFISQTKPNSFSSASAGSVQALAASKVGPANPLTSFYCSLAVTGTEMAFLPPTATAISRCAI